MKVMWESPSRRTRNDVQGYAAMPEGLRRPTRSLASVVVGSCGVSSRERLRLADRGCVVRHHLRSMRRAVRGLRSVRRHRQEQRLPLSGLASNARCVARDACIRLDATRRFACVGFLLGSVAVVPRIRSRDRRRDRGHSCSGGPRQAFAARSDV